MKKIFVGNLAWGATEEDLKNLFEAHGAVVSVKIVSDQYTGKSKGFGFIEMETAEGAQAAIAELDGKPYLERSLRVSLAQDRPAGDRAPGGGGGGGFRGRSGGDDRPRRDSGERGYSSRGGNR
jgi:RNA recognition motif-containing protein